MAAKGLWQTMTGWMTKSDDSPSSKPSESPSPQQAQPAQDAAGTPQGADSAGAKHEPRLSPAPLPLSPIQPFGAPATAPSAAVGQQAVDPNPKPDEGPEINRKIIEVIKTCYDPEIPVNIFELGLIYGIEVNEEDHARITMTLTAPNCPAAQSLPNEVKFKVEAMDEIKTANVDIVFDPPWTPNKMSDAAKLTLNIL